MSTDDDQIRRALSADTTPVTAHSALRAMRPAMQQARVRRRVAAGATVAALLVGGGAGVFALTARDDPTSLRSVTSDQVGGPVPTMTETVVSSTTVSTTVATLEEPPDITEKPTTAAPASAPPDDVGRAAAEQVETPPPAGPAPVTPVPEETPAPVSPVPASFQTITSACGDIVVSLEAGTVQIVTITARPGFDPLVSDGGPTSIEMTFVGEDDQKCELHAEVKSDGLDVEVQNPDTEG